ncbi:MAG TPA: hypothetical protein VGN57_18950 [Pirellulaceae bacterium]|jgi:hypothetical protein|nr:hypothetical protein [Pirellulaceae bacterium]
MASLLYNQLHTELMKADTDLESATIKVALLTSSYTPNKDHDFFDDVSTYEASGTGYTAGGATLGSKTVTKDDTNDRGVFDAADVSWASSSITARYAVVYRSTGTASTSPLLALIDFGSNYTSSNAAFSITWNPSGIFYYA